MSPTVDVVVGMTRREEDCDGNGLEGGEEARDETGREPARGVNPLGRSGGAMGRTMLKCAVDRRRPHKGPPVRPGLTPGPGAMEKNGEVIIGRCYKLGAGAGHAAALIPSAQSASGLRGAEPLGS